MSTLLKNLNPQLASILGLYCVISVVHKKKCNRWLIALRFTHLCLWQLYTDNKDHHESNPVTENDCIYALCALLAHAAHRAEPQGNEPQAIFESVERVYTVWIINPTIIA